MTEKSRAEKLLSLALNIDQAIQRTIANKDPETVDLLLDIRRELLDLYKEVREMKETIQGMAQFMLDPDRDNEKIH